MFDVIFHFFCLFYEKENNTTGLGILCRDFPMKISYTRLWNAV